MGRICRLGLGLMGLAALLSGRVLAAAPTAPAVPTAAARDEARAMAVLEASRAAAGGAGWARVRAIRYRAEVASGAEHGTAETLEDARTGRYVDRYVLGAVRGGQGFDGALAWSADVSGHVSAGAAEGAESSVNEVYRRSLSYWFRNRHAGRLAYRGRARANGREFERIAALPAGGRAFELWVDAHTHLIARLVEPGPGAERVTELGDYRRVQGLLFPFAARTSLGDPRLDTVVTFTSIEIDPPLPANAFARPDSTL